LELEGEEKETREFSTTPHKRTLKSLITSAQELSQEENFYTSAVLEEMIKDIESHPDYSSTEEGNKEAVSALKVELSEKKFAEIFSDSEKRSE